jgi:hypothetical protein
VTRAAQRRYRIQTEGRRFRVTSASGQSFLVWAHGDDDAREEGVYRLLITYGVGEHRIVEVEEVLFESSPSA